MSETTKESKIWVEFTSTIKEILNVKEWNNANTGKTVYYFRMMLENWDRVSFGKTSNDAFKVWDTVTYTFYKNDKGEEEAKEVRANSSSNKTNFAKSKFDSNRQHALTNATTLFAKANLNKNDIDENLINSILKVADKMVEWLEKK